MRAGRSPRAIPAALGLLAFVLAFVQRPGLATSDTKINLHVAPGRFLHDVLSTWSATGDLGHVQSGQLTGYLAPMGPFFALGHALGLGAWVTQRLWLGAVLALAAWGTVRLLDALVAGPRGVAHASAGLLVLLNPFVVTFANRTTVTLLAYAALPWVLLAVHRGVRDPRGWSAPALIALAITLSGPGVNAAVTAWVLVGPLLLLLYEPLAAGVPWRHARAFAWRAALLGFLASLWWIVPAALQTRYGVDFLAYTEQPGTLWGTTSASESVRLMGFWLSYVGVGFGAAPIPYFDDARTLLFSPGVVGATFLLPAAAFGGFAWTRRARYGPFFALLALAGVLVMIAGYPEGTPLRHGMTFLYNHVASVRVLRASYKAGPLLALGLACLGGMAAGELWRRRRGRLVPALGLALGVLVAAGAAWPLVTGRAQDRQVSWKQIPAAWRAAARDLDTTLPENSRALVLPGQLFAAYDWGETVDPILPALAKRPVAVRQLVPYGDLRGTELLWTVDALVRRHAASPGQLRALLGLLGVRRVITGLDDDARRSGGMPGPAAERAVRAAGLGSPARRYGTTVERRDLARSRGLVRLEPVAAPTIVDGSAPALAGLAAFGALPRDGAIRYAADESAAGLRREAAVPGARVVVSDSNRRRAYAASAPVLSAGPTLEAGQDVSEDGVILDPFRARGTGAQTVAVLHGARSLGAPASPEVPQHPEHGPWAAWDGRLGTAWYADRSLTHDRQHVDLVFTRPRDVAAIALWPASAPGTRVGAVAVNGRTFTVHPGRNVLHVGLQRAAGLSMGLAGVTGPGAAGIAEVRVPGLALRRPLRLPVLAAGALRGRDLSRVGWTWLFERTAEDRGGLDRAFVSPLTRTFRVVARVSGSAPSGRCGALAITLDGRRVPLRASRADPRRAVGCAPVRIGTGTHELTAAPGPARIDALALDAPAEARAAVAAPTGRVTDPGHDGGDAPSGVRVAVHGPSWLVLGESYDRGWRASCDGHDLGAPVPIDGYANGWRVGPGCRAVAFPFAPNRAAHVAFAVSLLAALACAGLLGLALRRRRRGEEEAEPAPIPDTAPGPAPWGRAAAGGVIAAAVLSFVFGPTAGVPAGAGVAVVLRLAIPAVPLALAAGGLLAIVVPILDLLAQPARTGNEATYPAAHPAAQWFAVGALLLMLAATARSLASARRSATCGAAARR